MTSTRLCTLGALTALALTLYGCEGLIGEGGPEIASASITPDTIAESSTGMTDQFFDVTLVTSGFAFPIEGATVEIEELGRAGETTTAPTIDGDTIVLNDIAQSWFQGVPPGEYPITATVFSEDNAESVTQLSVVTVTVTE